MRIMLLILLIIPTFLYAQNMKYNEVEIIAGGDRIKQSYICKEQGILEIREDSTFINGRGIQIKRTGENTFKGQGYFISIIYKEGKPEKVYVRKNYKLQIFYIQ